MLAPVCLQFQMFHVTVITTFCQTKGICKVMPRNSIVGSQEDGPMTWSTVARFRDLILISMAPCAGKDDDALVMLALIATAVFTATAVFSLRGAAVDSGPLANHY